MLENNFNELDNDFVTIWSRYLINHDEAQIINELEKLAELGQINAIQSYYLIMGQSGKTQINSIIDKKLEENAISKNFNYLHAEANKNYAQNSKHFNDLMKEYNDKIDEVDELEKEHRHAALYEGLDKCKRIENKIDDANDKLDKMEEEIKRNPVVAKEIEAINACYNHAQETQNIFVWERYFELVEGTLASDFMDKNERKFNNAIKQNQKELAKRYKTNQDAQTGFVFGKSLIFFNKKDKNKQLGIEILTKLAERPLSKTLSNYMNNGKIDYQTENKPYLDLE